MTYYSHEDDPYLYRAVDRPTTTDPGWWRYGGDDIAAPQPRLPGFEDSELLADVRMPGDVPVTGAEPGGALAWWQVIGGLAAWAMAFVGEAIAWTIWTLWTLALLASWVGWI